MQKVMLIFLMLFSSLMLASSFTIENIFLMETPNLTWLIDTYHAIISAGTLISGFVLKAFIKKESTPQVALAVKVFAAGLVIAAGFSYYGFTNFLPSLITIASTMGLYDLIKGIFKKNKK